MLPRVASEAELWPIHGRSALFKPTAAAIAHEAGLRGRITRIRYGMNVNFAIGDGHVLKLLAPPMRADFDRERIALAAAAAALDLPVPRLAGAGERDGWTWLLVTRVAGRQVREVWRHVPPAERRAIATELGQVAAALHRAPAPPDLAVNWPVFRASQIANAPFEQARKAKPGDPWLPQIADYLAQHAPPPAHEPPVLLHADLHNSNVLLTEDGGRWRLGGIVDFGDAFLGPREYEFMKPGMWVCRGDRALFRSFLAGYGYEPPPGFHHRMLAWTLIHRFGALKGIRLRVHPHRPKTLEALAEHLYGG